MSAWLIWRLMKTADASAVEDADCLEMPAPVGSGDKASNEGMDSCLLRRRHLAGTDGPDGLWRENAGYPVARERE
jgi:hypothetical protein